MTITTYEPTMTMREARKRYFEVNEFGETGGYEDAWVDFEVGSVPFPFPNTKGRIRAVKVHDLHHIVTGYDTNTIGEFEISAWEIGAGCKDFYAAWALNLGGMSAGLLSAPRRTFRAFVRGRHSSSLYGSSVDELLGLTVADVRAKTGVDVETKASAIDAVMFAAIEIPALVVGAILLVVGLALLPLGLVTHYMRNKPSGAVTS